jgi:hypothetical protein
VSSKEYKEMTLLNKDKIADIERKETCW